MSDDLRIIVESDDKRAGMYLQGRLGIKSSPELRDRLFAILRRQSPPETLFINFEAVSYMDRSGIANVWVGWCSAHASPQTQCAWLAAIAK